MDRRRLTDTARRSGGAIATARGQGRIKKLEKPSSSHGEIHGTGNRITGDTGKSVDGERVAEGPAAALNRGNARGAKGAGHPRRDWVNGQPEEPIVSTEGGSPPRVARAG